MSQLPGAANATIADDKITQYLLNPTHRDGSGKAKFFTLFGFSLTNPDELKNALLQHPLRNLVTDRRVRPHGITYEVGCSLITPDGRNPCIISVWIIGPIDPDPRFVTAYPNPPQK